MEGGEGGGGDGGYRGEAGVDMEGGVKYYTNHRHHKKSGFFLPSPLLPSYISRCLLSFVAETATILMLVDTVHVEF